MGKHDILMNSFVNTHTLFRGIVVHVDIFNGQTLQEENKNEKKNEKKNETKQKYFHLFFQKKIIYIY
jgi:heat shock protein HspQ